MKTLYAASGWIEKDIAEMTAQREAYNELYIQEHGYLPSIWDYDSLSMWFMLIGFIGAVVLMRYLMFVIPYTKQLIKNGNVELKSKLRNMYNIVVFIIIAIIAMGIFTVFKYSYPGYIGAIFAGLLFGIVISRKSKRNISNYHSSRKIRYSEEDEVNYDRKNPNKNVNTNKLENQFRNTKFYELVEVHINKQKIEDILAGEIGYVNSLPLSAQPLVEDFIDKWNIKGYDPDFWHTDTSEVLHAIKIDASLLFEKYGIKYDDDTLFYMFQIIVLNFAYSAYNQPEMRKFMKSK